MLKRNFRSLPMFKTERLTLRQLVINDNQEIFTLRSDSEINKYLDRPISHTVDDARNFIKKDVENNALYGAVTSSNRNILVGTICLFSFSEENDKCEIGYELLTSFQGQGIMKKAAEKVIDFAFHTLNVQKVEALFHRDNQGSL